MLIRHEHHVYLHGDPAVDQGIAAILAAIAALKQGNQSMFEDLQAKVDAIKSASDAAEALLNGLKQKLDEFLASSHLTAEDQAKLEAISASIGAEAGELAAAVEANTPAA